MCGYDEATGTVHIEHNYTPEASLITTAKVDMNAVLGTAPESCFEIGSWINVIGYIRASVDGTRIRRTLSNTFSLTDDEAVVQAILVWSAGAILIPKYEEILERHKQLRAS